MMFSTIDLMTAEAARAVIKVMEGEAMAGKAFRTRAMQQWIVIRLVTKIKRTINHLQVTATWAPIRR